MCNMGDKLSEEEVQTMMKQADINGDGVIDYSGKELDWSRKHWFGELDGIMYPRDRGVFSITY